MCECDIRVENARGPCTIQHKLHAVFGMMVLRTEKEPATHKRQTLQQETNDMMFTCLKDVALSL